MKKRDNMSFTLWFTGLPASGKTTLARVLYHILENKNETQLLDSDDFVAHLDEYFESSPRGRALNNRCMAIVCRYLNQRDIICLATSTSPRRAARSANLKLIGRCIEIYCKCPLEIAEKRDPKGLYRLARQNRILGFTGIGEIYEEPHSPDITVNTGSQSVSQSVSLILDYLKTSTNIRIDKNSFPFAYVKSSMKEI